jgi:hypothetical protein
MAALAGMAASGTVDAGAPSRAVDGGVYDDAHDAQCGVHAQFFFFLSANVLHSSELCKELGRKKIPARLHYYRVRPECYH